MKAPKEQVLYYYAQENEDVTRAKMVFTLLGVRIKRVPAEQFGRTVGVLAGILEEDPEASAPAEAPADDIMVFCGFSEKRLDLLLSYFRKVGISKASYKAMLTPTNALWTMEALYRELQREREEIAKRQK